CGGHIAPILVGAKRNGIRVIDVRNEATAVFAADAMSRLTGTPGVAAVTAGPGVTNSVTAVKNAQKAQSPLILLGGAVATLLKGRGALQDIDQLKLYDSITKWAVSIQENCDIVPILEEAFDVAKSGVPGPVFIECPIDLLYEEDLVREWYGREFKEAKSLKQKIINWYVRRHVDKLFACSEKGIEIAQEEEIEPFSLKEEDLQKVLSHLKNAEKPVLVIGSQATLRTELVEDLSKNLRVFGVPVYLTGMARGLMGEEHLLYYRHNRSKALKEADVVIIAGMPCDFRLHYGQIINKKAVHIAINRSKEEMKLNKRPNLAIQADPGSFLNELLKEKVIDPSRWNEWRNDLNKREAKGKEKIDKFSAHKTKFINPLILCQEINQILDEKSILVGDGGDFVATASYTIKPKEPLSWLDPGPYGTLGVGAGFALAAKLVYPEKEVWLIYGDGAAGYSIMEYDTFVRHKIPIIGVVGNDAGWTQIERDQVEYLNDDVGTQLEYSDYANLVRSYGAKGLSLQKTEDIKSVLLQAKKLAKEGNPVLVNSFIGKTDYRKGSISM
ncbi:MAG: thiamine pyrophosphate-binding protein, partial [Promethearchaeia archaeon]